MGKYYEDFEIKKMQHDIARDAVMECLREIGFIPKDEISQREAHKLYGPAIVKRWIALGLVQGERKGIGKNSKIVFPKRQLELLAASEKEVTVKRLK